VFIGVANDFNSPPIIDDTPWYVRSIPRNHADEPLAPSNGARVAFPRTTLAMPNIDLQPMTQSIPTVPLAILGPAQQINGSKCIQSSV
jgi:hypothetical protein